ncbi:MAG TPA: hypothetical protein VLV86_18215 [Vicinamibacterales bacterium]|nr:hypothetical protein [Vicinamibacterales bacterium]
MDAKTLSIWITIASAIAGGYARFLALEEAKQNHEHAITDVRGYLTALEGRTLALERDRQLLERVHALEVKIGTLEERIQEGHRR